LDLNALLQDDPDFKSMLGTDEAPEEASDRGTDDGDTPPDQQEGPEPALGGFNSVEELLQAYRSLEALVQEKTQEAQDLGQLLQHFGDHAAAAMRGHEDHAFLNHVRDSYDQDPVGATAMMIRKYQEDALNHLDSRMQERLQHDQNLRRFMNDFLNDSSNAGLKPHRNELEILIGEHGVPPHAAAEVIRKVEDRRGQVSRMRSDAATAVRNRAMVENAGEVGEPMDKDKEFDKILKKAKTLDEMFSSLRKLNI
jgi:hypothetical protein